MSLSDKVHYHLTMSEEEALWLYKLLSATKEKPEFFERVTHRLRQRIADYKERHARQL